jgi:serine/threonine-protein kinase HipA
VIVLGVWVRHPDGAIGRAGDLACTDPDAHVRFEAEFEYAAEWLADRRSFALDPESLPTRDRSRPLRFRAENLHPPLSVFEDALPDDWGRRLLVLDRRLPRAQQGLPYLLRELGADGLGALAFADRGLPASRRSAAAAIHLDALVDAAARLEAGEPVEPAALPRLLDAGSSPGGARPKALVDTDDGHWIAKFSSRNRDGRFDVVGLEATALALARDAGLEVPETRLLDLQGGHRTLLVRRFDMTPQGGRRHMVSLKTLCKERPGVYVLSYDELASAVRKHSAAPRVDVEALIRHAVFNVAIGNTDDHLKNFWMLHDERGWRLAPAFDLVPDVAERREHVLRFHLDQRTPSPAEVGAVAKSWGVRNGAAIAQEVIDAVRGFPIVAARCRVPAANIAEIGRDIEGRLATLAGALSDR